MEKKRIAIWWMKKDFRIHDNPALKAAVDSGLEVLPLFIVEPSALRAPETSNRHVQSWFSALKGLSEHLSPHSLKLNVVRGEVLEVFEVLRESYKIAEVHAHQETGFLRTFDRDLHVGAWCRMLGISFKEHLQTGVFRRLENRDERSKLWRKWTFAEMPQIDLRNVRPFVAITENQAIERLSLDGTPLRDPAAEPVFHLEDSIQTTSEAEAMRELESFLYKRGLKYSGGISSPNTAFHAGSRLSVHLAWGTLSPRLLLDHIAWRMEELLHSGEEDAGLWRRSLNSFKGRISWRDHFIQRLEAAPDMEIQPLNQAFNGLETTGDSRILKAWVRGETGFPLVDACIRCAQATGFLNFRMRCMITSVACHALRLDWKKINWPMCNWWTDFEPGIQIAQLQMQAGVVGINTLRTYNPGKQIADHDKDCEFVKKWVPELRNVKPSDIIEHQTEQTKIYIKPLVDWRESVNQMRNNYYEVKRSDEAKVESQVALMRHGSRKGPLTRRRASR